MAQTNAQRQAAYRARHLKHENGMGERISVLVDVHIKRALERLASRYKVTQRAMLQTLIANAESKLLSTLPTSEQDSYYSSNNQKTVTR